jgi:hypothetical protein
VLRRQHARPTPDHEALLRDLAEPGCPICREHERREDRFFFWFFVENYHDPGVVLDFSHALGFCPEHAAFLRTHEDVGAQLTFCYLTTTQWLLEQLGTQRRRHRASLMGANATRCPACRSQAAGEHGSLWAFTSLFRWPETWQVYGAQGLFCFVHLREALRELPAAAMARLYGLHHHRLAAARQTIADDAAGALVLALGVEDVPGRLPMSTTPLDGPRTSDPVAAMKEALARPDRCPVCVEEKRAWVEWMTWLIEALRRGEAIDDVLPQCPQHLWSGFRFADDRFARAIADHALVSCLHQVEQAQRWLACWERDRRTRWGRVAWDLWRGRRERLAFDRTVLRRPQCPVCRRMETAARRALELIGALLLEDVHARAFHVGYGLCVPHYLLAQHLALPPATAAVIEDVEGARLAELEWTLAETQRKDSWSMRPETRGAEQAAWREALRRFAGTSVGVSRKPG